MTSLRQLMGGLQRLSINSVVLSSNSSATQSIAGECLLNLFRSSAVAPTLIGRQIHCSATCFRQLDNRKYPHSKFPSSTNNRWQPRKKFSEMYEYTTKHLPFPKTGGRGPNGRIWTHRIGGGHKRNFRMIDWIRGGPADGQPLIEKVESIQYDPNRSARIALVASGEHKRYIIATQNMKAGDLLKSSTLLSKTAIRASEGDAYPLGSLPIGTLVNCIQRYVDHDARAASAAGVNAQIIRKLGDMVVVRLPSKQELAVPAQCQATIGRVSNIEHNQRIIGKAGRNRWLGIRPSSGRWHRKTGRFGRKIRPLPPVKLATRAAPQKPVIKRFTF